jgi:hypothetical protein
LPRRRSPGQPYQQEARGYHPLGIELKAPTLTWAGGDRPGGGSPVWDQSGESVPFTSTRRTLPVATFPLFPPGATRGTRFAIDGMGVIVGPLVKRRSRWLLVGVTSIHLPRRITCALTIGTLVRVAYTEREGRRLVETIQPLPESPPVPRLP